MPRQRRDDVQNFNINFYQHISVDSPKGVLRPPQLLSLTLPLLHWRTPGAWHVLLLFCMEGENTKEHLCTPQELLLAQISFILMFLTCKRIEAEALVLTESWVRYVSQ